MFHFLHCGVSKIKVDQWKLSVLDPSPCSSPLCQLGLAADDQGEHYDDATPCASHGLHQIETAAQNK